ncbi:hypothetical protein GCM10011383_15800 [Hymenobacter cavernae]|uniref:Secretion system C-terminal sorting domain-containing protein n=1 Tax=Hymenobacter cavernae TaxID=2044852 RepID=A0ABQ1TZM3_9BACT|nr:hypothetical protein GCM10011383_15800 [Hymenobacter cavernae]
MQAQQLDPSFQLSSYYQTAVINDALQQPDGKWLVAGSFTRVNGGTDVQALARLNTDGTLDQTFAANATGLRRVANLQMLPSGRILLVGAQLAGESSLGSTLLQLNLDGTRYTGFLITSLPNFFSATAAAVQPDGRILVGGPNSGSNIGLLRLLPNGSRDASFQPNAVPDVSISKLLVQPDGKILVVGRQLGFGSVRNRIVVRLNADGSLDNGFDANNNPGNNVAAQDAALLPDGRVLVAGYGDNIFGSSTGSIVRLLPDGSPDQTFKLDASMSGVNVQRLVLQEDGKIVAALQSRYTLPLNTTKLIRLEANGSQDASFQIGDGPDEVIQALRLQEDGRLLVGGYFWNFNGQRRSLALLESTGAVVPGFAPLLQQPSAVSKIVRLPDGKLLVNGDFQTVGSVLTDKLARLMPDGTPDATFSYRNQDNSGIITHLVGQPDGKVLLARRVSKYGSPQQIYLQRLNVDGSLDVEFSMTLGPPPSYTSTAISLLTLQPDGRILVGGWFSDAQGRKHLIRLLPDGTVDTSFNPTSVSELRGVSALLQADGKITCIGMTNTDQPIATRLLPTGAPDPTFAFVPGSIATGSLSLSAQQSNGSYLTVFYSYGVQNDVLYRLVPTGAIDPVFSAPIEGYEGAATEIGVTCLAVQPDDKVLVGGKLKLASNSTSSLYNLIRLDSNGRLDNSFNTTFFGTSTLGQTASVRTLLVLPDGATLVGGAFTQVNGRLAMGVVKLQPATVTGTKEALDQVKIMVYPNPAHDQLTVKVDAVSKPQSISLIDVTGRTVVVYQVKETAMKLAIPQVTPGVYLLRVNYADGPVTRRVVIQ